MTATVTKSATRRERAGEQPALGVGLAVKRVFSTEGVHPYDEVTWQLRDVVQTNWKTGEVVFEQHGVEFPDFWSVNASTIVTNKYFRGALGTPQREASLKTLIDRVVGQYVKAGRDNGYFATDRDAEILWGGTDLAAAASVFLLQLAGVANRRHPFAAAGFRLFHPQCR